MKKSRSVCLPGSGLLTVGLRLMMNTANCRTTQEKQGISGEPLSMLLSVFMVYPVTPVGEVIEKLKV